MSSTQSREKSHPTFEPSPSNTGPYPGLPLTSSPTGTSEHGIEYQYPSFTGHEATIPDDHEFRTVVLCFDGTGDQFDDDNSNVVNFFSMLKKDDPSKQLVYYQTGIGTYNIPEIARPTLAKLRRIVSSMVANDLDAHVMAGYEFLMQNYQFGDKICLFGFSRGAYTARALAGMVHKVGLLPRHNHQQVPFAYKMYSRKDEKGWRQSVAFKKAFSIDVDIEFVGVWDTVGSVGVFPRRLPFTTSNTHVRYFRHALSLDERRVRFAPAFWIRPTSDDKSRGVKVGDMPRSTIEHKARESAMKDGKKGEHATLRKMEKRYSEMQGFQSDVEEVWFAGCHADVGGGSVLNGTRNSLARIPLRWMIRQCFMLETGIMFHKNQLRSVGLDPDSLYPHVAPRPGHDTISPPILGPSRQTTSSTMVDGANVDFLSEEHEDYADAMSPIYDQLTKSVFWWLLELVPQKIRYQRGDDSMAKKTAINMGKPRIVPHQTKQGVKVHRTVKMKMEAEAQAQAKQKGQKYTPKVKWCVEPTWVD